MAVLVRLDRRFQLLAGDLAVGDRRLVEQEVDDLVLIKRRAQLGCGHRGLADIFGEPLTVFLAILLRRLRDEHVHFLRRHFDAIGLANLGEQQAEAHAAHRDRVIFVAVLFHLGASSLDILFLRGFLFELRPDLVELGFDHRGRNLEVMIGGQLVEQAALHVRAGQAVQFLLELALDQAGQLLEAFEAERLGEIVVELGLARLLHLADDDVEGRGLACEILGTVIFGEGHVDHGFVIGLQADELVLETGDELARTDDHGHAFALAAFERHAIDLAFEVDDDLVAFLGLVALGRGVIALLAVGDALQRLGHGFLGRLDRQALERDRIDRRGGNLGQHFERDLDLGILAGGIILIEVDRGLDGGAQIVVADRLVDAFLDRGVERVGVNRFAVHLANQVGGHLAGAETGHAHLRRDLLHLRIDPGVQILGGDGDGIGPLQALVQRLDNLHRLKLLSFHNKKGQSHPFPAIHAMVRAKGLEPPHLSIPEPKSGASTSFATPASR